MIERLIIVVILAALGCLGCRLYNRRKLDRVTRTAQFDPVLLEFNAGTPGILLFTADFCAPCKLQQQPAIQRVVNETGVQYIQVDVAANPEAAERWGVLSLPTTYILDKDGKPREVNHGITPAEKLKQQLQSANT